MIPLTGWHRDFHLSTILLSSSFLIQSIILSTAVLFRYLLVVILFCPRSFSLLFLIVFEQLRMLFLLIQILCQLLEEGDLLYDYQFHYLPLHLNNCALFWEVVLVVELFSLVEENGSQMILILKFILFSRLEAVRFI